MKKIVGASVAAALAYAILLIAAPPQTAALKNFREGNYTAEQASRGQQVYVGKCAACHGDNLQGVEMAPALSGATFKRAWDTQPMVTLANRIKATMPPFAPNSLSVNELTDLVSFLL